MSNKVSISYVMPVYNEQSNICMAIKSIHNMLEIGDELIIIEDKSTDNTLRIIEKSVSILKGDITVILSEERKGAAYSRNLGNLKAKNEIIAVCDAEKYYATRGEAIKTFFTEFPEKSVFYSSLNLRSSHDKNLVYLQEAFKWDFQSKCPISHPTVAYKKELALKCKYYEKSVDTDLFEFTLLDMHKEGADFGGCQEPLLLKIEGNRNRDWEKSREIKKEMYKEYGIDID